MTVNLQRGPLTGALLAKLADVGKPIGDGQAPAGGGWQGEPGAPASKYVPYLVLIPLAAQASTGPLADSQGDWRMPYQLVAVGVRRDQVELMADRGRDLLGQLRRQKLQLGTASWAVQQVRTEVIGGVARNDTTDPPYWTQADQVSVWLTKERSR